MLKIHTFEMLPDNSDTATLSSFSSKDDLFSAKYQAGLTTQEVAKLTEFQWDGFSPRRLPTKEKLREKKLSTVRAFAPLTPRVTGTLKYSKLLASLRSNSVVDAESAWSATSFAHSLINRPYDILRQSQELTSHFDHVCSVTPLRVK